MLTWLSRSLCLPSVSLTRPLSPLLSPFALACSCCLAWFPLLLHRWKLLSFTVLKRMRKRVATKQYVRRLRGSVSQNLISDLVCTSFGPRLNCSQSKPSPERFWKGFAMVCCLVCCCLQAYINRIVLPASELVHFDRRCANGISTWRKIIDVWRKEGAMRVVQVLVNGVGSRRGSGQRCFARLISH